MSKKRLLLAVFLLAIGFSMLAAIPAQAQSGVEYDCAATRATTSVPSGWQCSCPCATCRLSCSQIGSASSSSSTRASSSASLNFALKQQMASTLVDAFVNLLFSTDSKAAAQKQQMMEELAHRKAEAERQHQFEEAQRLDAICNRLSAALKLNGLPGLQLKAAGSPAGGLHLKIGNGDQEHVGVQGLPGIALNDTTGNGGNTPYGISGLPGIYTNGPGSGSGSASSSGSTLRLKTGEDSAPPTQPAANQIPVAPPGGQAGGGEIPQSSTDNRVDPQNMTPQQLADAATLLANLPPEEQQRLMNAAAAKSQGAKNSAPGQPMAPGTPNQPAISQLQQVANASQSAASAASLEDAAAKARLGFDQAIDGAPKPGVALAGTSVPVPDTPSSQSAATSAPAAAASNGSSSMPGQTVSLTPLPLAASPAPAKPEPARIAVQNQLAVAAPSCPPGVAKLIPSRQQLQTELAVRRAQLESLKNTIMRLNRTIQLDQGQFAVWEDEASAGLERVKGRIWDMSTQFAFDNFVSAKEAAFNKKELLTALDKDQMRKLARAKELKSFDDYRKWVTENKGDWTMIEDGLRQLIDALPIEGAPKAYIGYAKDLIDNAYDLTDLVVTSENVQQLDHNSTQFLEAVRRNGARMTTIVTRIQQIETQLNATPALAPNASPCGGAPVEAQAR